MPQLEFIHVTGAEIVGDDLSKTITAKQHLVRSQVMKDFRRKERNERMARIKATVNGTLNRRKSDHETDETAQKHIKSEVSHSPRLPLDISTSKTWRHLFAQRLAEEWYPPEHRVATLYNISYTYDVLKSAPIVTMQDTLSMLNAGSVDRSDRLVLEARRGYIAIINLLRHQASRKTPELPVAMLAYLAMACLMCETYSAIAYGSSLVTWQKHVLGISALAASFQHGDFAQVMNSYLIQQIRVAQLVYSLYDRRPFPSDLAIQALPTHQTRLQSLLVLAFKVPRILEAADSAMTRSRPDTYDNFHERLTILKTALKSWLEEFSVSDRKKEGPNDYGVTLGIDMVRSEPTTTSPDATPSIINLTCETLCRICLLLIVESLVDLESRMWPSHCPSSASDACASDLLNTMAMLEKAAITPICKARSMSAPLYFLSEYYTRHKDRAGLRWCQKIKEALEEQAPYLHWDALLPWCFLTLGELPHYDADARG